MSQSNANRPVEAEKGVVASILFRPEDINLVAEHLSPTDFSTAQNALIYDQMQQLHLQGSPMDAVLITEGLKNGGNLDAVGGVEYFLELVDPESLWASGSIEEYAEIIQENSARRKLQRLMGDVAEKTQPGSGFDSRSALAYLHSSLQNLTEQDRRSNGDSPLAELAQRAIDAAEEKSKMDPALSFTGVPTGFLELDEETGGLKGGQMVIVAGRPAMGKTTMALNMATAASMQGGKSVMFFSLEMSENELAEKMLAAVANVEHRTISRGQDLTPEKLERMADAAQRFAETNFIIRDNPKLSLVSLESQCLMQKSRPEGLDLVVIDYLQLMDTQTNSATNREVEVAQLSKGIKQLAKKLDVPIIILAQLNRGAVQRSDKTPNMADLRESGSLEQDADIILMAHRPEYYDPNDRPGVAELVIAKIRAGQAKTIELLSLLQFSKFANKEGRYIAEPDSSEDEEALPPDRMDHYGDARAMRESIEAERAGVPNYDDVPPPPEPEDEPAW